MVTTSRVGNDHDERHTPIGAIAVTAATDGGD
jgi:hypothetical protein